MLGAMTFLLVLASIGGQVAKFFLGYDKLHGFIYLFDVDRERNIPTYFSMLLMLFAALLLVVITVLNRKQRTPHVSKWSILSFGFLFMAADEGLQIHERLEKPVRMLLGGGDLGIFNFAWVIPGIALVLVLALFFLRFLLHLPAKTRLRFMMAATIYIGGAIGFEMIGGRYTALYGADNFTYRCILVTIEESLEMVGLIVFIWALLDYCADSYKEVLFRFEA